MVLDACVCGCAQVLMRCEKHVHKTYRQVLLCIFGKPRGVGWIRGAGPFVSVRPCAPGRTILQCTTVERALLDSQEKCPTDKCSGHKVLHVRATFRM